MKVCIAGSRTVTDYVMLLTAIERSGYTISEVVCGMAVGVDLLGEKWAIANNIPIKSMPADWNRYGKRAGPMRNADMADYSDAAILLWDGSSPGTKNMISCMTKRNKPYYLMLAKGSLEDFM